MIELSRSLGREKAHDVVHEASRISIAEKISLEDSLTRVLPEVKTIITIWPLLATDYLGNSNLICAQVIDQWNQN